MSVSEPLITLGILCRNEGAWLEDCWKSVLAQTTDRWTAVLVMDGGASAETRRIFDLLQHPKLRKYSFEDYVGHYSCSNRAFEMTLTPYHFFVDGRDELLRDSVATALETFRSHSEADFVYGDLQRFGGRTDLWGFAPSYDANDLVEDRHPPIPSAYKRELWTQLGGFARELSDGLADADFFIGAYE